MISPKIPAASAGIVGAGPSTRTAADRLPSSFVSVLAATTHDPPTGPEVVTGHPDDRVAVGGTSAAGAPAEPIGTSQDFAHR